MKSILILISGPYRGGTNDDPQKVKENLQRLEEMALPFFGWGNDNKRFCCFSLFALKKEQSKRQGYAKYQKCPTFLAYTKNYSLFRRPKPVYCLSFESFSAISAL